MNELRLSEKSHETLSKLPDGEKALVLAGRARVRPLSWTLREVKTLSKRTVITLGEVIKVTHAGYRCPGMQCPGYQRTYRSAAADALALPGFTYGVDIVLLFCQATKG